MPDFAYYGYFSESEKLLRSASGGAVTAVAEIVIAQGGVVFGVKYTSDFKDAEYVCVKKLEDLEKIKGSIYVETRMTCNTDKGEISVFQAVANALTNYKKVLFVGLGCGVGGLQTFLIRHNISTQNLLCIDLICHGPTVREVSKQFINDLEKKYKSRIEHYTVRYKKGAWLPIYLRAEFVNGSIYEKRLYHTDFGYALNILAKKSCYDCKYKGDNHKSDITVGDYWGLSSEDPNYNKYGVSAIICHNQRGKDAINRLNEVGFVIYETSLEKVYEGNEAYLCSRKYNERVRMFEENFKKYGLHRAVMLDLGIINYIKREYIVPALRRIIPKTERKLS